MLQPPKVPTKNKAKRQRLLQSCRYKRGEALFGSSKSDELQTRLAVPQREAPKMYKFVKTKIPRAADAARAAEAVSVTAAAAAVNFVSKAAKHAKRVASDPISAWCHGTVWGVGRGDSRGGEGH